MDERRRFRRPVVLGPGGTAGHAVREDRPVPDSYAYSEVIDAPQPKIVDTLLDFEHYPEWQSGVYACTVKERDEDGRGSLVELHVDAKVRRIRYTARYWYDLEAGRMGFDLVEGDLAQCTGRYRFEPRGDGATTVSIDIVTEVGFFLPRPVMRLIRDQWLKATMRDLRRRVGG